MPKCNSKTKYLPATVAWALLLSTTSLFFYFPCQYYLFRYPWVPAFQGIVAFFVLANFTLATFMDPGVIPKAPPDEDREDDFRAPLYKSIEINGITVRMKWCVTCKFYRPPRCSHCSVCNHCIETFDHHCPWVNNCIGRRNYRFFFFFLLSLSIHMTSIFVLCLHFVLSRKPYLGEPETIISMILMGLVTLLFIPIFGLTGFHVVLVSRGRTTNEQVTGKFNGGFNPFSQGILHNCCVTLFGSQFPSLMKPEKYSEKQHKTYDVEFTAADDENQSKTYMDSGNGIRSITSNAYNKLSPGKDGSDIDMDPTASQSADCEPTPPLERHDSKNNFFQQQFDCGEHHQTSSVHPLAIRCSQPSPQSKKRMNLSNPTTPKHILRPNFIDIVDQQDNHHCGMEDADQQMNHTAYDSQCGFEPSKKLGQNEIDDVSLTFVGNIRELAESPQKGVYTWKDFSPSNSSTYCPSESCEPAVQQQTLYEHYYSDPKSQIQQILSNTSSRGVRNSIIRGGVRVLPPIASPPIMNRSPVITPIINTSEAKQRLISNVTSANIMEGHQPESDTNGRSMNLHEDLNMNKSVTIDRGKPHDENTMSKSITPTTDRSNIYDINYEISV